MKIKPDWEWVECVLENALDAAATDGEATDDVKLAVELVKFFIKEYEENNALH